MIHRTQSRALFAAALTAATLLTALPSCASNSHPPNAHSDAEAAAGWTILFDGTSMANFRGYKQQSLPAKGWAIRDDCLCRLAGAEGAGDIVTRDEFADFEFACDWKVAPGGNSGIIYRCTEDHGAPYETGPEYQILDDAAHADGAKPRTRAGSMYDLFPSEDTHAVRPAGQWNSARIIARGPHIEHWLNGVKVVDIDLTSDAYKQALARSKWVSVPDFAMRAKGHIALQDHGAEVCFRNIRVRSLN